MRPPSCMRRRLAALDAVGPGRTSGGSTSSWRPPLCAQVHCAASSSRAAPASTRSTDGLQQLRQGSRRWQSSSVIQNQQLPPQQAQREHPISPPPTSFPAAQSSTSAKAVPSSQYLKDRHHRTHSYLRISLTEKCNLRCLYCMPEEGVPLTPSDKLLSQSELARLARLFVQCGVSKVRLTGGEPTLRRDLPEIMESLNELRLLGLRQIGMTSNGIALHRKLPNLVRSGLTHLNLSLDTLDPFKFELMTRRPAGLDAVLRSLDTALELGMDSVKINVVVLKGVNDTEDVLDFVAFTRDKPVTVRFIEYMPFDGNKWAEGKLVPYRTLLEKIQHRFGPLERLRDDDNDTSKGWRVPGFAGSIGFITSMTEHFCGTCNRLRITADGNLKVCLFGNAEVSLRDAMRGVVPASTSSQTQVTRSPATDAQLLDVISAAVQRKHARHADVRSTAAPTRRSRPAMMSRGDVGGASPSRFSLAQMVPGRVRSAVTVRLFSSSAQTQVQDGDDKRESRAKAHRDDVDDLSDLDFSYEPHFERLNTAPRSYSASSLNDLEPPPLPSASRPTPPPGSAERSSTTSRLTHVDPADPNRARMVDVSHKAPTTRTGTAVGKVFLPPAALDLIRASESIEGQGSGKGPVLRTAQLAGIMGAKRTAELIPLCHPLGLTHVDVKLEVVDAVSEEDEALEREEAALAAATEAAFASSEAFIRQATGGMHRLDDPDDGDAQRQGLRSASDFGFRIEDLVNADGWRGRDFDMNEAGSGRSGVAFAGEPQGVTQPAGLSSSNAHGIEEARSSRSGTEGTGYVLVTCTARTNGPTGVEMEALLGANIACLTVWDMVKAVAGREMWIGDIKVVKKMGGKSGDWERRE